MKSNTQIQNPPMGRLLIFPGTKPPPITPDPKPAVPPPAPPPEPPTPPRFFTQDEGPAPLVPMRHGRIPPLRRRLTRPKYFDVFGVSGCFDELTRILELCRFRYLRDYKTVNERNEVWAKLAAEAARARRIPCLVFPHRNRKSLWMPTPLLGASGAGHPPPGVSEAMVHTAVKILRSFPPSTAALIADGSL